MITLHFDGLYRKVTAKDDLSSEAGLMCYGWLISRDGIIIGRGHGGYARNKDATSNVAEYLAMIEGLEALLDMGLEKEAIEVIGDARSIIEQMQGTACVSSPRVRPLYQRASRIARRFPNLRWTWAPRRYNHEADQLTRRALRQIRAGYGRQLAALEQMIQDGQKKGRKKQGFLPLLDLRVFQPARL